MDVRVLANVDQSQSMDDLITAYYDGLDAKAKAVFNQLNLQKDVYVFDEGSVGGFPWFWQSGTIFNRLSWDWFNNVFQYNNDGSGFVQVANGDQLITGLNNVFTGLAAELSASDQSQVNQDALNNATKLNDTVTAWTSVNGAIPAENSGTPAAQLQYVTDQIMTYADDGKSLNDVVTSKNPKDYMSALPLADVPALNTMVDYYLASNASLTITTQQSNVNRQIAMVQRNLNSPPETPTANSGWMNSVDPAGVSKIIPYLRFAESPSQIQNELQNGNISVDLSLSVTKIDESTVDMSVNAGAGVRGWIDFLTFNASGSASYNVFSADKSLQTCTIKMTYDHITTATPVLSASAFDITTDTGWWDPGTIKAAVANTPLSQSGVTFANGKIPFDFDERGNFGAPSAIVICSYPTFELVYKTSNVSTLQSVFQENSSWGIGLFGFDLFGGSQSYSVTKFDSTSVQGEVRITMSPPDQVAGGSPLNQLAYVLGVQIAWPAE